jgi:hypothetical protein
MGGICSTHRKDEKCLTIFWLENLNGRDHFEDLGVDVRILLEWILEKCRVGRYGLHASGKFCKYLPNTNSLHKFFLFIPIWKKNLNFLTT